MTSQYLSKSSIKGLNRIGDILIPGNNEFPSFSEYMCIDHIDDLLNYVPPGDIKDLGMVLGVLSYCPKSVLTWLVKVMSKAHKSRGAAAALLRQLNMGIRGIVFSLYYSEKPGIGYKAENPCERIGFTLNKVRDGA
ncbi:MAG: hypothetical protein MI975_01890 [Cytophagales bacterium]|nr:hypothetical protein [Cytophagales bacterium]